MPPSYLSEEQRETLAQFESITARNDERSSLELLDRAHWNLESAISQVYDSSASASASYPPSARETPASVDDALLPRPTSATPSNASFDERPRSHALGTGVVGIYYLRQALAVPIHLLAWPLGIVYNLGTLVLGFVARLLGFRLSTSTFHPRNPFASSPRNRSSNRNRRRRTILSPAAAAQNWVDSVHRTVSLASALDSPTSSSSSSSGGSTGLRVGSSSSSSAAAGGVSARRAGVDGAAQLGRRRAAGGVESSVDELPEFFVGGYEQALRKARDELRVLLVVLTCDEHERDEEFKRTVLTDPDLVATLKSERVIVWGGDVLDRDAYQVGRTLSYTCLPFVAFIALQPTATSSTPSSSSSSSPRLSLISRLEPAPASSVATLSASTIDEHLRTIVLPKSTAYLARLAADRDRRERDRVERERADERLSEVARRDERRIVALRAAAADRARAERERTARLAEDARLDAERRERAERARRWRERTRRAWAGTDPRASDPDPTGVDERVRVVVRLGNGTRVLRKFSATDPVDRVYEWVECELGREEDDRARVAAAAAAGPDDVDETEAHDEHDGDSDYVPKFAFRLATTFPRQLVQLPASRFEQSSPSSTTSRRRRQQQDEAARARKSFDSLESSSSGATSPPRPASFEEDTRVATVGAAFRGIGKDVSLVVDGLEERRRLSMSSREEEEEEEEEEESEDDEEV
ncbi:hypothetical protein JCM11491_001595 [Sporobolomyces phaffii]